MSGKRHARAVVAVDAMGGDFAPAEVVAGAVDAATGDEGLSVILVGDESAILAVAPEIPGNITIEKASSVIDMSDHAAKSVREKRDASVVVSARLVKEGHAGAFVSAGNTGAAMAAALMHLGRIPGIARPAIAVVVPTPNGPVVLLDAGANADCKPEYLAQFGVMGSAYASCLLGIDTPRVGLLNIGQEKSKGSRLYRAGNELLEHTPGITFVGNIEGRDLIEAAADVAVADGFVGNMVLKVMEGLAEMLFSEMKGAIADSLTTKLGGLLLHSGLKALKKRVDYEEYGGTQLLGVRGGCVIAHGGSRSKAIGNAVREAARVIRTDAVATIAAQIERA